jgi:hypothetical protein
VHLLNGVLYLKGGKKRITRPHFQIGLIVATIHPFAEAGSTNQSESPVNTIKRFS